MALLLKLVCLAALTQATVASPLARPFDKIKRQANPSTDPLEIDLGYEIYKGVANSTTGLNTFKGIRYAAPPVGQLRWQAPQPPASNRSNVISASSFGSVCPQTGRGSSGLASLTPGLSEDCLFLSVYSPRNASGLPVLFWIHGGGYGQGDGRQDMSNIITGNDRGFVGVAIQYRLGAFGFLSSDEVYRNGVVNAGLLDQHFALQWVQSYIELFGGDPTRVTIAGVSAGAGSVMLHDMAYSGTLGTSLFINSISASPFLPQQYGYKDWIPTQSYYAFATAAGCPPQWAYGNSSQTIFQCLLTRSTDLLQNASTEVSNSGTWGAWAFLPVTDGTFIQTTPSQGLLGGKLNGINHLSGNNAEEGRIFTTPNITTENDLVSWIQLVFPLFTQNDIAKLLYYYPSLTTTNTSTPLPKFATSGDTGLTALDVSQTATGQQQRADTIYAESTFICPSYWIAQAYNTPGKKGYKYQYSVLNAVHGSDMTAYFGTPTPNQGPDLVLAFERIWGNFIMTGDPSISMEIAVGARANSSQFLSSSGLDEWPPFVLWDPRMVDLNQTGGVETVYAARGTVMGSFVNVTTLQGEGVRNAFRLVDGYAWEGWRGVRCDFWRNVAGLVPE